MESKPVEHTHQDRVGQHPQPNVTSGHKRDLSHIQGWGADLDHKNRPAYPMERTPPRLENVHWEHPENQPVNMKVYHSTERPGLTPVFGTSSPPSGLSGKIRDVAFRLSENDIRHWLLLLVADRVNMVEGIGQDLKEGHIPNVFSEMGLKSELKYNPVGFARKVLVTSAIVGGAYYLLKRSRKSSDEEYGGYENA